MPQFGGAALLASSSLESLEALELRGIELGDKISAKLSERFGNRIRLDDWLVSSLLTVNP